ncbi:GNAT family N-acetyltransferase [Terasakiella sp.]|uniref:GNAT family N-acetyltransferase n=1 Tax=Terasakiella sp. TaxID=2034861 RepID=UPI003AA8DE27
MGKRTFCVIQLLSKLQSVTSHIEIITREIRDEEVGHFKAMTFPRFRPMLKRCRDYPNLYALGAWYQGRPAGLVLLSANPDKANAELLSVFVLKALRQKEIGSTLLKQAETFLGGLGVRAIETKYSQSEKTSPAIEKCLSKAGWPKASLRMILFKSHVDNVLKAQWVKRFLEGADGGVVSAWNSVSVQESAALEQQDWIPQELKPSVHASQGIDGAAVLPELCFVCRLKGDIIGWHFSHRLDEKTVRFSVSYVHPDQQANMVLARLWYHAAMQMKQTSYSIIRMGVAVQHGRMQDFCKKWLSPLCDEITYSMGSFKVLHQEQEAVWI